MTTLATDTPRSYDIGDINEFPVIAADIIYEGSAVGLVSASGHARPLTSADRFVGFCEKQVDNSDGAAAALYVRVKKRGKIQLSVSGAVITDIGNPVYATDDNTFVFLPTGGVFVGFVHRFVSSGIVIVRFNAGVFKDPHEGYVAQTVTDDLTLDAEDSGKVLCVTTTAVIAFPSIEGMSNVRLLNCGAFGTVQITADPDAGDMIEAADITGSDGAAIINTLATARRGDFIDVDYGDSNGWVVTKKKGVWAQGTGIASASVSASPSASQSPSASVSSSPSASASPS
jgi:hypothetical protein